MRRYLWIFLLAGCSSSTGPEEYVETYAVIRGGGDAIWWLDCEHTYRTVRFAGEARDYDSWGEKLGDVGLRRHGTYYSPSGDTVNVRRFQFNYRTNIYENHFVLNGEVYDIVDEATGAPILGTCEEIGN